MLQLRSGWRKCAAILNAIALIVAIVTVFIGSFGNTADFHSFGKPLIIARPQAAFLAYACAWLILCIWVQIVLAKRKPLFESSEICAGHQRSWFTAARIWEWTLILALLSYTGIWANNSLTTIHAQGTYYLLTGKREPVDPHYYQTATVAFRKLLEENNFQRMKNTPVANFGIFSQSLQSKDAASAEYFSGSYKGSPKFTVFIPPKISCINYSCSYSFKDYKWRVRADEKKVKDFVSFVSHWWKNYKKLHPLDKNPS